MDFNLQRQCRIAGTVIVLLGVVFRNFSLLLFGNLVWVMGYAWSITKIEKFLEESTKTEEDDK